MVVNFNPGLVRAELEARTLAALGLPPPPAAAALHDLTHALAHARPLHQVWSYPHIKRLTNGFKHQL